MTHWRGLFDRVHTVENVSGRDGLIAAATREPPCCVIGREELENRRTVNAVYAATVIAVQTVEGHSRGRVTARLAFSCCSLCSSTSFKAVINSSSFSGSCSRLAASQSSSQLLSLRSDTFSSS